MKNCILEEDMECIDCGECNICDLDPQKICDNCCKCIENSESYKSVIIDGIELPDKKQIDN